MHFKIISNSNSGHNRKNPKHIEHLAKIVGNEILLPSLETLDSTIASLREEKLDILGISGGDGTIHQTLSAMYRVYKDNPWPKIVLLSNGTMNNIAKNVGIRTKSIPQLQKIVNTIKEKRELTVSTRYPLIFDDEKAGFIFGQGGIAKFLEAYYEAGNPSQAKAAYLLIRAILSSLINGSFVRKVFAPVKMDISADGKTLAHNRFTVSVLSSVSDLGFGFRPCYAPLNNPKIAQFIGFTRHPVITAFSLPKIRLALPVNLPSVQDSCGTSFVLTPQEPMAYTIDGDLYTCRKTLHIRLGPPIDFVL